ncbi:EAL domain-containing protein [Alicyclobacillus curvatus]|nr:EAL domain-containing protein [Alicyclobacillus curvatus]
MAKKPFGGYYYPNYPTIPNLLATFADRLERLDVVYQPIINHAENSIFAYEALSRPQYQGRLIPPDLWFRTACESNLSVQADLLALFSSIKHFRRTLQGASTSAALFVNVMPSSVGEKSFREGIEFLFEAGHCRPQELVLEIIEYVSYDPSQIAEILEPLRGLGVRIALDDVGVGSTNLLALVELEPDFIKIDRSLIQGISASWTKQRLLKYLTEFMQCENSVIAEGVEYREDLLAIRECGVRLSQGYYWSPPVTGDDHMLLTVEIEKQREALIQLVEKKGGILTDDDVVTKSQELDLLLTQHCRFHHPW